MLQASRTLHETKLVKRVRAARVELLQIELDGINRPAVCLESMGDKAERMNIMRLKEHGRIGTSELAGQHDLGELEMHTAPQKRGS